MFFIGSHNYNLHQNREITMKLYLVWNEAKTECVGFVDEKQAIHAQSGKWPHESQPSYIADEFFGRYCEEQCTITEIEV